MKLVYETSATWHPLAIFSTPTSFVTQSSRSLLVQHPYLTFVHLSHLVSQLLHLRLASILVVELRVHISLSGVVRISCPRSRSPLDRLASFSEALMTLCHGPPSLFCIYRPLTSMLLVLFRLQKKKSTSLSFIASHPSLASTFFFFRMSAIPRIVDI
jgi:hypothetical protein